jgi:hypothetical protein
VKHPYCYISFVEMTSPRCMKVAQSAVITRFRFSKLWHHQAKSLKHRSLSGGLEDRMKLILRVFVACEVGSDPLDPNQVELLAN